MTNEQNYGLYPDQDVEDKKAKSKKRNKRILKIGGGTLGGLLLFTLGVAAGSGGGEPGVVEREVEVIKEVEVPGEEIIKEVQVEVDRTPDVCKKALDEADGWLRMSADIASISGDLMLLIPEAAEAGMNWDADWLSDITTELEGATKDIQAITAKSEKNKYAQYRDECLSK